MPSTLHASSTAAIQSHFHQSPSLSASSPASSPSTLLEPTPGPSSSSSTPIASGSVSVSVSTALPSPPFNTPTIPTMSAQPNPPLPPLPNFSIPPPPTIPTPPPIVTPPSPQPEPPKPPTNSPQPSQPDPAPAPTNPPAPPSSSPSPPPTPPTVVITSVDTHIIPTIVTSTFIRVTNTADGSSTSTLVGVDSHGSLVPIPPAQTGAATSNGPAATGSPSISSAAAANNGASTGMSNAMLVMVVAVPLVAAFFIAIAVTLLKRRSDLKRYQDGIATRPRTGRPPVQPAQGSGGGGAGNGEVAAATGPASADAAVDSPLISVAPPVHQYSAEQQQEYAPVPQSQPTHTPNRPVDSNVYLDPAPAGGYYQSHPPPSPTATSTSASGSLFVAPGPPRVVDPTVPMLMSAKQSRSAAPRRASNLRYSFNGQAGSDATGSLVAGMDEGVQFSRTPMAQTGRLS